MKVRILETLGEAGQARGVCVVIDVFRAATTACVLSEQGAEVLAAPDLESALRWRAAGSGRLVLAERGGEPRPEADLGNSPHLALGLDLAGRQVAMCTSAGTPALFAALAAADAVLMGAFVNASALERRLRELDPEDVTLLAAGAGGVEPCMEDRMAALYLKNQLEAFPNSMEALDRFLRGAPAAQKFLDPALTWAPAEDLDICLTLDRVDFALAAESGPEGLVRLVRA
ncbi:MAG: 2-phosphosulfolactate phosphatase [Desulfovibrionaceae bacterium]